MKRILFPLTVAAALAACDRPAAEEVPIPADTARITLRIAAPRTKAGTDDTAQLACETALNSLEAFVFRVTDGADDGYLDAYKKISGTAVRQTRVSATVEMEASTGDKHIYVVANGPDRLAREVDTEASFLKFISDFADNGPTSFLMVGSTGTVNTLGNGSAPANTVEVPLRRLVARVKVEQVSGAFRSARLRETEFRVQRIYLANVPRKMRLVNGDYRDVFGTPVSKDASGTVIGQYYPYETPEDFYNLAGIGGSGTVELDDDANVSALTARAYPRPEDGMLFTAAGSTIPALEGNVMKPELYLYTYPNSAEQTDMDGGSDDTTKLIIETTLDGKTYYYPISLGYTQPNYAYTVHDIVLTRLGSTDPNIPVTTAACSFEVTVSEWDTGTVIGRYNGQGLPNEFTI